MTAAIFIVCEGDVEALGDTTRLPPACDWGRDWIACAAESEADALELAIACDRGEADADDLLSELLTSWAGPGIDRLAWHLYREHVRHEPRPEGPVVNAIRWGAPRTDGRSLDHATGRPEPGVSACEAQLVGGGWQLADGPGAIVGTLAHLIAAGARPYLVRGIVVGRDSDGALALSHVELVGALRWDDGDQTMRPECD